MLHSSVAPPHGSFGAGRPRVRLRTMFQTKTSVAKPMSSAPTVETRLSRAMPASSTGGEVERGRGMPRQGAKVATPQCRDTVEDLHARRYRDEHGRGGEHGVRNRPEPHREHMVAPHAPPHEPDEHAGVDDHGVAEQRLARERG